MPYWDDASPYATQTYFSLINETAASWTVRLASMTAVLTPMCRSTMTILACRGCKLSPAMYPEIVQACDVSARWLACGS